MSNQPVGRCEVNDQPNILADPKTRRAAAFDDEIANLVTDEEVEHLAQILRSAYVLTQIGRRSSGFTMVPWDTLVGREKASYLAQAVAAFRYFKALPLPGE